MKTRICFVTTVEYAVIGYLTNHILALSAFYDVTVITNTKCIQELSKLLNGKAKVIHIPFRRKFSLFFDLLSLLLLIYHLLRGRFATVHSLLPKSGLLSMVAGSLCGVPTRVHTFTGQVWANKTGFKRLFLQAIDRLIGALSSSVLADSKSQMNFLIDEGVIAEGKIEVLAEGSVCGVDTVRFRHDAYQRECFRCSLSVSDSDVIILYLGRMTKDKGLLDLAVAFNHLCSDHDRVHLVLAGPDEENIQSLMSVLCSQHLDKIHFYAYTNQPELFMNAADIFCLPSYREGFGSVIIESAAVGLPTVASRIYGITDAVDDKITGLLHIPGDISDLEAKLRMMVDSKEVRTLMGEAASKRSRQKFAKDTVTVAMINYYQKLFIRKT